MKILVLIRNNLLFDTRVKRHLSAMHDFSDHIHVLARPDPDCDFHLDLSHLSHSFFDWTPLPYPATQNLRQLAQELDVFDDIWPAMPLLLRDDYYEQRAIEEYFAQSKLLMDNDRYTEILAGEPMPATDSEQIGWVMSFYDASIQYAEAACEIPADIVYCNDIDTLLCGVAHKKRYGSRLIYDAHDIFCDCCPGVFPREHRYMLARFERALLPYADMLISVNDSAVQWFKGTYGSHVPGISVSNCSVNAVSQPKACKDDRLRLYFHGTYSPAYNLPLIMRAVAQVETIEFIVRCLPSPSLHDLEMLADELRMGDRFRLLPAVSSDQVIQAAQADGDFGIVLLNKTSCINLRLALTNKFIEYLQAGLPVITASSEVQADIVNKYHAGFDISGDLEAALITLLHDLSKNRSAYLVMSKSALYAANELFDSKIQMERLRRSVLGNYTITELKKMRQITKYTKIESLCKAQELKTWKKLYVREAIKRLDEKT